MGVTLAVLAHPRRNSLTGQVTDLVCARLQPAVDLLDLYREGFDPRMGPADEPDWQNHDKKYSTEVHAHMNRILAADEIVVVFPIWWSAPPAILKGWIDRVWNLGFAYGRREPLLGRKRMLWIGLASGSREDYARFGTARLLDRMLRVEISHFCGIADASLRFVHNTKDPADVIADADAVLDEFIRSAGRRCALPPPPDGARCDL